MFILDDDPMSCKTDAAIVTDTSLNHSSETSRAPLTGFDAYAVDWPIACNPKHEPWIRIFETNLHWLMNEEYVSWCPDMETILKRIANLYSRLKESATELYHYHSNHYDISEEYKLLSIDNMDIVDKGGQIATDLGLALTHWQWFGCHMKHDLSNSDILFELPSHLDSYKWMLEASAQESTPMLHQDITKYRVDHLECICGIMDTMSEYRLYLWAQECVKSPENARPIFRAIDWSVIDNKAPLEAIQNYIKLKLDEFHSREVLPNNTEIPDHLMYLVNKEDVNDESENMTYEYDNQEIVVNDEGVVVVTDR